MEFHADTAGCGRNETGDHHTWRKRTDPDGNFQFDEVRPGHYSLTVDATNIPEYHEVDPPSLDLDLQPGETRSVEFRVNQLPRRIQILPKARQNPRSSAVGP